MSKNDFNRAMEFVLKWEGGFVDHPNDPGGATNYGISSKAHGLTYEQVKNLTKDEAKVIYYQQYWLAAGCDKMDWPMNLIVFDTAVNVGVSRAKSWIPSEGIAPDDYLARRMRHYISLTDLWPSFGRGWMNRVQDLLVEADWKEKSEGHEVFDLVQVFSGSKVFNFHPVAQTIGRTNDGKPKLMVRVPPLTFIQKLKILFSPE
jgi:lysozyme family protein